MNSSLRGGQQPDEAISYFIKESPSGGKNTTLAMTENENYATEAAAEASAFAAFAASFALRASSSLV